MNVLYVKIKDENQIRKFKKIFCIVDLEEIFNGYIAKVPLSKNNLLKNDKDNLKVHKDNKKKKLTESIRNYVIARKIRRIVNEKNIDGIILADEIVKNDDFVNKLILSKKVDIEKFVKERNVFFFDGNGLFKYIIYEVLEYIINIQNRKAELEDIYIIANNIDEIMLNNITFLSTKFKNINIFSKNIEKYKYVEDFVYNNTGNNIILLNNKRKSLKRAKYIINVDNSIRELNEYLIYRKAIIINVNNNKNKIIENKEAEIKNETETKNMTKSAGKKNLITLVGFDGIVINSFEIDVENKVKQIFKQYKLNNITNMATLYDSFLNKKENFWKVRSKIEDAGLIVTKLYGNNGIIDENEYKRVNINDNDVKKYY